MDNATSRVELGTILCKYCEHMIATFDSEKITFYYSDCQRPDCLESRVKTDRPMTEC
ncbi:GapA-binding peptide SR1P [Paenibacillus validus]|uniref:GapA-binding peptide SR1P n=1 Tax=Paenibacillus validus TaxID=44253 RepID=A0A7X2Z861_9BACL|nr:MULTISPECIES: GapA-binding peptide SR1P [Paenibacillus]MED4599294.1 GapA-binding peptide SR1P [Paenibacillus validus]MED4606394.1 GapA-binding peptide SR1P [Paenibacillus validus]MUG70084.1 GapA-binding peptide SR1P [Paenibacillus validus]